MEVECQVDVSLVALGHRPYKTNLVEAHLRVLSIDVGIGAIKSEVLVGRRLRQHTSRKSCLTLAEQTYTCRVGADSRKVST